MKITEILSSGKPTLSFEVFPPKKSSNYESVAEATEKIAALHPAFMSVTYGAGGKSEPPSPGEVIYRDDFGAVCRCWNWREAERTMLTEETVNAFMIIEAHDAESAANIDAALDELKAMIETELGGTVTKALATADSPEVVIAED